MPFPFNIVSYTTNLFYDQIRTFSAQCYAAASGIKCVAKVQQLDVNDCVILSSETSSMQKLRKEHKKLAHKELSMRYNKGVLKSSVDNTRPYVSSLTLLQRYGTSASCDLILEDTIVEIQDYLSASDILTEKQRDNFLSLPVFGDVVNMIMRAQHTEIQDLPTILRKDTCTLSENEKTVRICVEDMHILVTHVIHHRYDMLERLIDNKFHTYLHLNEIMQLLFMIHNTSNSLKIHKLPDMREHTLRVYGHVEEQACSSSDERQLKLYNVRNLELLRHMYVQQDQQIIKAHKLCTNANERITQIGQHNIHSKFLDALQMFLAIAACRELSVLAHREFSVHRSQYLTYIMELTQHYVNVVDGTILSYRLFTVRMMHLFSIYYNHRALLHLCKLLTKAYQHKDKIKEIVHILRHHNDIVFDIVAQTLSHLRACVVIHVFNNCADVQTLTSAEAADMLTSPHAKAKRDAIVSIIMKKVLNGQIAQKVVLHVLQNAQIKRDTCNKVIQDIFALYHSSITETEEHKCFQHHIQSSLDSMLCNMRCDIVFMKCMKEIVQHIDTMKNTNTINDVFKNMLHFSRNQKLQNDMHNMVLIAQVIDVYDSPMTFKRAVTYIEDALAKNQERRHDLMMLEEANLAIPYQSHIIYVLVENMLHKAQKIIFRYAQLACASVIMKVCGFTVLGYISYEFYYT